MESRSSESIVQALCEGTIDEYESFVVPDESAASSLSSYGLTACVYRKL